MPWAPSAPTSPWDRQMEGPESACSQAGETLERRPQQPWAWPEPRFLRAWLSLWWATSLSLSGRGQERMVARKREWVGEEAHFPQVAQVYGGVP